MESAKGKLCPIRCTVCVQHKCAWWCAFGDDCAVPLLTGILADSTICQTIWPGSLYAGFIDPMIEKLED